MDDLVTTTDEAPDSSPEATGDSPQGDAPLSQRAELEAAFERASGRTDRADAATPAESQDAVTETATPAGDASPGDTGNATPTSAAQRMFTEQQAFDRAMSLHKAGRMTELPPEVQGQIRKFEAEIKAAHAEETRNETEFNEMYLDMLALEVEDPAEFARQLRDPEDGTAKLEFLKLYQAAHPDVSLDNPRPSPRGKTEAEIRSESSDETATLLRTALRAYAEDMGVKDFDTILASAGTGKGALLVSVTQAAVEAQVAKQVDKIRKAEREAATKEAMAAYGSRVPSISVSSSGRAAAGRSTTHDPKTIREAYEMASSERT